MSIDKQTMKKSYEAYAKLLKRLKEHFNSEEFKKLVHEDVERIKAFSQKFIKQLNELNKKAKAQTALCNSIAIPKMKDHTAKEEKEVEKNSIQKTRDSTFDDPDFERYAKRVKNLHKNMNQEELVEKYKKHLEKKAKKAKKD